VGVVAAVLVAVPGLASGAGAHLTWNGYRGVHPGESLSSAAGHLGVALGEGCGAHRVTSGRVVIDDRASDGDGTASSITTTSRRVKGPAGVHVGMSDAAVRKALGRRARSKVVAGHRVRLLRGPHHRVLWTVASGTSRRAKVTTLGLSPSARLAKRAAALTVSGCPAPPVPHPPPACPDPLPATGPYESVSCEAATGVVTYTCTDPDWLDQNGLPADGCEREVDGLVPMTFKAADGCSINSAALALADRIGSGGYQLGDAYACGCRQYASCDSPSTGFWVQPGYAGVRTSPAVPHCSADTTADPTFDCPGGLPADPAPSLAMDFNQRPNDQPRAMVVPVDVDNDQVTIRARVTTQQPIALDIAGLSCQVTIDSTAGSIPDLRLDLDLVRGANPAGPPVVASPLLTQLENADWTLSGPGLCVLMSPGAISDQLHAYLTDVLHAWADRFLTQWCGAPDPYWWQDCPAP
jgi:hypothetical protein